ncbi:putative clathrin assembly protein At1g03050 [Rutidosis leptorrhynchoides]|uniref:putative clathrin assembly protein At1g03050 n=1 Tax=Rutidosis leptorrhynchoides TaxID=125765 RepID=UPI003A991790
MSMGRFSKAIAAVKDQTSIRLAKAGNRADLDVAIVKATCHDEYPAEECYVQEILKLTSSESSPLNVAACVNTISQRLNKTRDWVVALKTLMLVQRLLHEGNPAYEEEIFNATRRGTRLLNMSDFRDALRSNTWDYAAFVRTYALFLDEELEYKMQGKMRRTRDLLPKVYDDNDEEHTNVTKDVVVPVSEMTNDHIFARFNHLMQLLERFLACRPTGAARHHRMIMVALYPILVQSFQLYYDIKEIMGVLVDRFDELSVPHSVKVSGIYRRVAKQFDDLDMFYDWCRTVGIARTSEYPEIEKIPQKKLNAMDERVKQKSTENKQED